MVSDSNLQEFGSQFKSKLATVAVSGNYNDLSNKPTIPTITNGMIEAEGLSGTTSGTSYALPDEYTNQDAVLLAADPTSQIGTVTSEVWTFELENGTTITKTVLLG